MDKLTMAHQMALAIQGTKLLHDMELVSEMAWKYADAMQAEAEKRKPSGLPEALCQVDWSQAPENAVAFLKLSDWDIPAWIDEHGIQIEDAPSFGFTGTHIVERPHGF